MENEKDDSYITTITNITTAVDTSCIFTTNDSSFNYTIDSNSYIFLDNSGTFSWSDPYSEIEDVKQQQEKEEELRNENSCLQEAWDEYQLILKLLEENECDKYLEKKYGMKND